MRFSLKAIFVAITLVCIVAAFPWYAYLFAALGLGLAMISAAVVGTVEIPIFTYLFFKQRSASAGLEQDSLPPRP